MQLHQRFRTLLLFCFLSLGFFAQRFPSKHLTIKDGLPSNAVYCVFKDSRGIVWIGTDAGLVKYDGYHLKTFTKKNGLVGNFIRDIKEDKFGNLWVACYGDGLTKFGNNKYTNYTTKNGLVNSEIRTLFFNSKGKLFIGTEKGLSILSENRFSNYVTKSLSFWGQFQVMQFCEIKNEVYFLSRTHGYFKIKNFKDSTFLIEKLGRNAQQVYFFNFRKSKYYSVDAGFFEDNTDSKFPIESKVHKKISDILVWDEVKYKNKCFLAAYCPFCYNGGLYVMDKDSITNTSEKYGIDSKQVWNLLLDKSSKKLWVSTLDKGVYIVDLEPKVRFIPFNNLLFFDKNSKGTFNIQGRSFSFHNSSFNYSLNQINFIGFAKRQIEKYRANNKIVKRKNVEGNIKVFNQLVLNEISTFYRAKFSESSYFVSTSNGIYELAYNGEFISFFAGVSDEFSIINSNELIWHNKHRTIYHLSKENGLWYDTPILVDKKILKLDESQIIKYKKTFFINNKENGFLQFTPGKGCAKIKLKKLDNSKIVSVSIENNDLYIATNEKSILHYKIGSSIKFINKIEDDLIVGESIMSMNACKNNLFVLTNRGLNIINSNNSILINQNEGLDFEDVLRSFVYENNYYLTTTKGVFELNLNQLKQFENPKIEIESIEVKNKKNSAKISNNLWKRDKAKKIIVDYNQNSITYHLKTNFLYQPEKLEISYCLNNSEWKSVNNQQIYLQELAIGKFDLKLKIRDRASGFYSSYLLHSIVVKPPFYKTNWFIFIVILLFFILGFIVYYINITRIKKRERLKSEFLKRIAETKLEALQSQMNPHFIFNSLTSIHNYIIKSDVDNALLYMDKFAKLTRHTLEFSSRLQITLLEELEYLSHFCALENMRFGDQVKVKFDAGELDTSKLLIPPLLIQPLVENAFEHGFTNREKAYELLLHFFVENEQLIVQVSDNGEGFEITSSHKSSSKAIHIIKERLSLLNPKLIEHFSIKRLNNQTIIQFALPIVMH